MGLTIRGFGLPSVAADAAKLAALKQFIGKGLAAGALMPTIAKVFPLTRSLPRKRW
jgi:hypothetical protein